MARMKNLHISTKKGMFSYSLSLLISLAVSFSLNNPWETENNKDK